MKGISNRSIQVTLAALAERQAATSIPAGGGAGVGQGVIENSATLLQQQSACMNARTHAHHLTAHASSFQISCTHPSPPPHSTLLVSSPLPTPAHR